MIASSQHEIFAAPDARSMKMSWRLVFVVALAILLPSEIYCVVTALETQGEVSGLKENFN